MYCKKCGAYNSNDSLICDNCGDYFINQSEYLDDLKEEFENDSSSNDDKRNNNQGMNARKKEKIKYKKIKKKRKKNSIFNRGKKEKKEKKNKNHVDNNYKEKEIVVKSSLTAKLMIFFLTLMVILLLGISSFLGIYILKDKVVMMPDVVGLNIDDATNILNNNDIVYEIEEKDTDMENINKVLEQNPDAGTYFLKNKTIKLTVGVDRKITKNIINNKDDSNVVLNNYIGMNIEDVKNDLDKLGIKYEVKEVDSLDDLNTIVNQYPSEGTKIDKNTIITLYVSIKKDDNVIIDAQDDTTDLNNKYS